MLFESIENDGRRLVVAFAVFAVVIFASCIQTLAEDQPMTILAHASSGPLQCEIRKNEIGSSVELTGIIASTQAIAGNFRFTVTKSGASGSSNINQGKKFNLAAGNESPVGQVTINMERDSHVVVELFAGSDDGFECRAKAPLNP